MTMKKPRSDLVGLGTRLAFEAVAYIVRGQLLRENDLGCARHITRDSFSCREEHAQWGAK